MISLFVLFSVSSALPKPYWVDCPLADRVYSQMLAEQSRISDLQSLLNNTVRPNVYSLIEAIEILKELGDTALSTEDMVSELTSFLQMQEYDEEFRMDYYDAISEDTTELLKEHLEIMKSISNQTSYYNHVELLREFRLLSSAFKICKKGDWIWNFTAPFDRPLNSKAKVAEYANGTAVLQAPNSYIHADLNTSNYTLIVEFGPANATYSFVMTMPFASSVFIATDFNSCDIAGQRNVDSRDADLYFATDPSNLVVQQQNSQVYLQIGNVSAVVLDGQTTNTSEWSLAYSGQNPLPVKSIMYFDHLLMPEAFQDEICSYLDGDWGECDADCGIGQQVMNYTSAPSCPDKQGIRLCQGDSICPIDSSTPSYNEILAASTLVGNISVVDGGWQIDAGVEAGLRVHIIKALFYDSTWDWDVQLSGFTRLTVNSQISGGSDAIEAEFKVTQMPYYIIQIDSQSAGFYSEESLSFDLVLYSSQTIDITSISLQRVECSDGCSWMMRNNSVCDPECDVEACNFDDSDCIVPVCECDADLLDNGVCDESCYNEDCMLDYQDCIYCWPGCTWRMVGDGNCDETCNNPNCLFDSTDCNDSGPANCSATCAWSQVGDNLCDPECMTEACKFDTGDCLECSETCSIELIHNGVCDRECRNADCYWDGGDCNNDDDGFCDVGCSVSKLHDGICEPECQTESCGFDLDDCASCDSGCTLSMLEASICSPECNTTACGFQASCSFCSENCSNALLGDNYCDSACNNEACGFDGGDCANSTDFACSDDMIGNGKCEDACFKPEHSFDLSDCIICEGECFWRMLGDGVCNEVCNIDKCSYDGGDCGLESARNCAENCLWTQLGDNLCDPDCDNSDCIYDMQDCLNCADGCLWYWVGDGECDHACNTESCYWDGADCSQTITETQCAPGCEYQMIGDGQCNLDCENEACYYDFLDCASCRSGCPFRFLGDGVCNLKCMNEECYYDIGDCEGVDLDYCAKGCLTDWLDDGICERECYVKECGYDGGDCSSTDSSTLIL